MIGILLWYIDAYLTEEPLFLYLKVIQWNLSFGTKILDRWSYYAGSDKRKLPQQGGGLILVATRAGSTVHKFVT